MNLVKAFVERGNDGSYGVYVDLDDNTLNYGIFGEGKTAKEAIDDFNISYTEMKASHEEDNIPFVEAEFEFVYDIPSFLDYYSKIFTKSGLGKLMGVNPVQLTHYVSGFRKPSEKTIKKMDDAIHRLADELNQVHFV